MQTLWLKSNHCDVIGPKPTKFGEITKNNAITPFKVIQGHQFLYQSYACTR